MTTQIDYEATGPNYSVDKLLDVRERVHQAIAAISAKIAPGMVDTDIRNASPHPAVQAALAARKFEPLTPQEVADAVVYAARSTPSCVPDLVELRPLGAA